MKLLEAFIITYFSLLILIIDKIFLHKFIAIVILLIKKQYNNM